MGEIAEHIVRRVECKRNSEIESNYRLSYHIDIPKRAIEKKVLRLDYVFTLNYVEALGDITVEGTIIYKDSPKNLKNLDEKWKDALDVQHKLYNIIFRNSVVMVMDMARHVGLPPPIKIPVLNPEKFVGAK